jgi:hypothetical protein
MARLSPCPRCGGKRFIYADPDDWYAECLQCSYQSQLKGTSKPMHWPVFDIRMTESQYPEIRTS